MDFLGERLNSTATADEMKMQTRRVNDSVVRATTLPMKRKKERLSYSLLLLLSSNDTD